MNLVKIILPKLAQFVGNGCVSNCLTRVEEPMFVMRELLDGKAGIVFDALM